ncbi:MAG: peptide chain release factor N(5)-glutamine methyltransferase [Lachnospiraceae bacterium]|nr:peptide chain release factor N(5)-glutamine methyltransferase [Lachnospiraceae bacterium]MBR5944156.1 peptide chain release factor N(5)-glutamine methyltransferase [Lachnospiraceae bacterium]
MEYAGLYGIGRDKLKAAGIDEFDNDARLLLEFVCDTDRAALLSHPERNVSKEEEEKYLSYIERRAKRIPLQHLTGTTCFMGLDFKVNENVLIPRFDTEILVEEALKYRNDGDRILDICTGSGCILISLLKYSNGCEGTGVDISGDALEVAMENAEAILSDKEDETSFSFVQSDLYENVSGKFDIIVSNPPYIPTDVIDSLMPEVKDHEPLIALDGKNDGLWFYERIIERIPEFLSPGGHVLFEIGYDQGEAVCKLLNDKGFTETEIVKDYAGNDRVVKGRLPVFR